MPQKTITCTLAVAALMLLALSSACSNQPAPSPLPLARSIPNPPPAMAESISMVLASYSQDLSNGFATRDALYSAPMKELLLERRLFYTEYFSVGLHSDLVLISSTYTLREITEISGPQDLYQVKAAESLHFRARYRYSAEQGYPPIEAARWAIAHTNNSAVQKRLEERIDLLITGLVQAVDGYDVDYLHVEHDLVIARHPDGLEILQDAYTDANPQDNPLGTDVIEWQPGAFSRHKPDFTQWEGYAAYHTSIEELGRILLNDYEK